jgi:hypothetical protein
MAPPFCAAVSLFYLLKQWLARAARHSGRNRLPHKDYAKMLRRTMNIFGLS